MVRLVTLQRDVSAMSQPGAIVETLHQLQKHVPSIVKAVNAEPSLALAAAVNPLFAIEELGYKIPASLSRTVEHRIRFSVEQADRLEKLSAEIHREFHQQFDIESETELSRVLHKELKPGGHQKLPSKLTLQPQMKWAEYQEEPLEPFRHAHPAMKLILEYRQIEASEPRLGSRELYDQVRTGAIKVPAKAITFQLKRGSTPK
jgi:DNA polymerase I-like protein with 3'-5' exonuclease and polymerase domains